MYSGRQRRRETGKKGRKANKATTKGPEMHFTIIQAESCDKVKIIIIFNII
jgi:hypothetical protein